MLVVRVRCVDDGRELLLERHGADEHCIQVAEIKTYVLQQRQQFQRSGGAVNPSNLQPSDLGDCFVLLRGQILADPDVVDLNALSPSDFFVFAPDTPQSDVDTSSGGEMHKGTVDAVTFELLRSQLVDMGFSTNSAGRALKQSGNNLLDAAALLAEGKLSGEEEEKTDMYPSVAPLGSLLYDGNVKKLRELAATDSFQAMLLLKEKLQSETLNQLNENPVETLKLFSLPAPEKSAEDVIEIDDGISIDETGQDTNDTIDRLVAMGFARDLVEVMYESCGGDEQLTANSLLQTLDS